MEEEGGRGLTKIFLGSKEALNEKGVKYNFNGT